MRKYLSIWYQLKKEGKCAVAAPVKLHPRIIKGVINEKYNDIGYKFLLHEDDKTARIEYIREGGKITFVLKIYGIGIGDL